MRIINRGIPVTIAAVVLCITCTTPGYATDIYVAVNPVRIIHIDSSGDIVRITSNTPQSVEPVVRKIGFIETDAAYDKSVKIKYEHVINRYDMAKPIEIQVKKLGLWVGLGNYLFNPILAML